MVLKGSWVLLSQKCDVVAVRRTAEAIELPVRWAGSPTCSRSVSDRRSNWRGAE
ncbi:MAG: hypothetical protein V7K72_10245 [Nostoc sp.]|uniref:hypothetical protein n=1 Tax=Nostoc sp. TaxID=1180 RepID=UPI002FF4D210